jgi:hypothetical protein
MYNTFNSLTLEGSKMKKILFVVLGLLILIPTGFIIFIYSSYDKRYDAAFPVPDL